MMIDTEQTRMDAERRQNQANGLLWVTAVATVVSALGIIGVAVMLILFFTLTFGAGGW